MYDTQIILGLIAAVSAIIVAIVQSGRASNKKLDKQTQVIESSNDKQALVEKLKAASFTINEVFSRAKYNVNLKHLKTFIRRQEPEILESDASNIEEIRAIVEVKTKAISAMITRVWSGDADEDDVEKLVNEVNAIAEELIVKYKL